MADQAGTEKRAPSSGAALFLDVEDHTRLEGCCGGGTREQQNVRRVEVCMQLLVVGRRVEADFSVGVVG